ncbi:Clp protease N-terminal domain-containing protein [Nocardiopsis sp. NPDC006139]|uniref:tetratricopeptide repeat protein n=1 Tax=Nocardiopsis sp. NPDC006139 TaxID=3154578 RepID=UPI0033A65B4F
MVWLDDLDRHLKYGTGLNRAVVHRLHELGAVVVATMRKKPYLDAISPSPSADHGGGTGEDEGRELLRNVPVIELDRQWSEAELERAAESGNQPLADAAHRQRAEHGHGVSEYLSSAPQLASLWRSNKDLARGEGGHPRGHRVVAAAVDLARIGVEHTDSALLEAAHRVYPLPPVLRPENFEEALAWATREHENTCGLLLPAASGDEDLWRPFDYLIDETDTPVPSDLWKVALSRVTAPDTLFSLGWAAYDGNRSEVAEMAWLRAAEKEHPGSVNGLGQLALDRGEHSEAESWFRRAVDAGHIGAMTNLGLALSDQGKTEEAESWYRKAIDTGSVAAMTNLGVLLHNRGGTEEAEPWYRRAADMGGVKAMGNLGFLLDGRGNHAEAVIFFRKAAEHGEVRVMRRLGVLLYEQDELDEAEIWLRKSAESGNSEAMSYLGALLNKRRIADEAEAWWQRAAAENEPRAMNSLGVLSEEQGKSSEAESWYRKAVKNGSLIAVLNLGELLARRGDAEEAEQWFRIAAMSGNAYAMAELGALLEDQSEFTEAQSWLHRAADHGDTRAMKRLAGMHERRGEYEKAGAWWRRAAENGDPGSLVGLGILEEARGNIREARKWYRKAAKKGLGDARRNLVFRIFLLFPARLRALVQRSLKKHKMEELWNAEAERGDADAMAKLGALKATRWWNKDEAEFWLRRAAEHGHTRAMITLADLLTEHGDTTEAEFLYRKAAEAGDRDAMMSLGHLFGKKNDEKESEHWYQRASEVSKVDSKVAPPDEQEQQGQRFLERFTGPSLRVLILSQEKARELGHEHTGTEHLLLSLISESKGVASIALKSVGVDYDTVLAEVIKKNGRGQSRPDGYAPFTPQVKECLEWTLREALQFGHEFIGPEHLLLGLLKVSDGAAAQALLTLGTPLDRAHQQVRQKMVDQANRSNEQKQGAFERFTDRARRVVVQSQEEARDLNHDYIGTEHLLLGLLREDAGIASGVLHGLGVDLETARSHVRETIGCGEQRPSGHIPFSPETKSFLSETIRASLELRHSYIGTEHLLLGLTRLPDCTASHLLTHLGADLDTVHQQVLQSYKN